MLNTRCFPALSGLPEAMPCKGRLPARGGAQGASLQAKLQSQLDEVSEITCGVMILMIFMGML